MSVEKTLIFNEAAKIATEGAKPIAFTYAATIHANNKNIEALFVVEREVECNFIENYTDKIDLEFAIQLGILEHDIKPFKSELQVTLRKIPLEEGLQASKDKSAKIQIQRYHATLYDNQSTLMEGNNPLTATKEIAERGDFVNVRVQLFNPIIKQIRRTKTGGSFFDITGIDLLIFLLTKHSISTDKNSELSVKGVTVLGKPNSTKKDQIMIPHLTKLVDVGDYIHENCGGLFSAGFKAYLQKDQWFVFPPYDLKAYDRSPKSLTVMNIPSNRLATTERTYRETPTQIILIATGEVKHFDFSEQEQLNQGNGVRFINANAVPDGFVRVEGNKMFVNKETNVQEFLAEDRSKDLNHVHESPLFATNNPLVEMGRLARRTGAFIQVVWENANPDILYPGMAVRFVYIQNHNVEELHGVLVGVQTHETATNINTKNRRFIANTALTLFVERHLKASSPLGV